MKIYILIILLFCSHAFAIQVISPSNENKIDGRVIEQGTGKPLAEANVQLVLSNRGTTTNQKGEFFFSHLTVEQDTLVITYMGYQTLIKPISLGDNKPLLFELERKTIEMPTVHVEAEYNNFGEHFFKLEPSARRVNSHYMESIISPSLPDFYTVLKSIPGISTSNEASPQISVRGGNFDQNLVLLDGVTLYYPFHYLGVISAISLNIIKNAEILPGGFSAQYGDRLSSVISIQTKTPQKKVCAAVDLNQTGADVQIGGKQFSKLSWLVSGRTSFKDLNRYFQDNYKFHFYDVFGKLKYNFSTNHSFEFISFQNNDRQNFDEKYNSFLYSNIDNASLSFANVFRRKLQFDNNLLSIVWNATWSQDISSQFQIYKSFLKNSFAIENFAIYPDDIDKKFLDAKEQNENQLEEMNAQDEQAVDNRFSDITSSFNIHYQIKENVSISTGVKYSQYNFNYGWQKRNKLWEPYVQLFFDYAPYDNFRYDKISQNGALFLEAKSTILPGMQIRTGFRLTKWKSLNKSYFEPRINLNYSFHKSYNFSMAIGRFSQGLSTTLDEGLVGFLPLFFPHSEIGQAAVASHFIIGMNRNSKTGTNGSISFFYKKFNHLMRSAKPELFFLPYSGDSYGFEAELSGRFLGYNLKLFYTFSKSYRKVQDETFYAPFDQRHRLQLQIKREIKKIKFSALWEFHSGQPYNPGIYHASVKSGAFQSFLNPSYETLRLKFYEIQIPKDAIRYPYYHRLDVSIRYVLRLEGFRVEPYVSVYNVYNRKNPVYFLGSSVDYRKNNNRYDYDFENAKVVSGIIPVMGIRMTY